MQLFKNVPEYARVWWQLFLWYRLSGQLAWTNLHFWSHLLEWVWGLNEASSSRCSNGHLVFSSHSRWIIWLSHIGLNKCVICHQLKTVPYWLDSSNASLKDGLKQCSQLEPTQWRDNLALKTRDVVPLNITPSGESHQLACFPDPAFCSVFPVRNDAFLWSEYAFLKHQKIFAPTPSHFETRRSVL